MTAIKGIETVHLEGQDHVVCALSDARVLSFSVDCEILTHINDNSEEYPPQI
jgi:hypothetical protein